MTGALALAAWGARAAASLRVVASSVPHAEILEFVAHKLAPDLPVTLIETCRDISPNALLRDEDTDANPKFLRFLEVASAKLPRFPDDVTLAIFTGNDALETGLVPAQDALALERVECSPYAQTFS